jgi:hypothetical protein
MSLGLRAQVLDTIPKTVVDTMKHFEKTITKIPNVQNPDTLKPKIFKPNPSKVLWMGAILPGYGQILNRKYWKLPIVYGGFLGCAYFISWNSDKYNSYKTAYRDIIDNDPNTTSYKNIIPKGYTYESFIASYGGEATFSNTLKTKQDTYRRYRDMSILVSIVYYGITLVDAFVDAQLYDFEISPDLSLRCRPTVLPNKSGIPDAFGMKFCLSLK